MIDAPKSLFMFVANGNVEVIVKGDNEERYVNLSGGMDQGAPTVTIDTHMDCDGGDW